MLLVLLVLLLLRLSSIRANTAIRRRRAVLIFARTFRRISKFALADSSLIKDKCAGGERTNEEEKKEKEGKNKNEEFLR